MTHQTIIEWSSPAACYVKGLGNGLILQNTLGSFSCNPQFLIKLESGELRTVDQNDICLYGNPSAGEVLESDRIKEWKSNTDPIIKEDGLTHTSFHGWTKIGYTWYPPKPVNFVDCWTTKG